MSLRVSPVPTLDCMRFSIWVHVSSVRGILVGYHNEFWLFGGGMSEGGVKWTILVKYL